MKTLIRSYFPALTRFLRQGLMVLLVFLSARGYAQLGTLSTVAQPIAPDAAALGKYVEMPVSNYSGLPDVNVPLYEFKAGTLSVPLSLSYHASGIKVRDIPGTTGSGWALNAGGVITRIVRGYTDGNDLSNPGPYKAGIETMGTPGGVAFPDYRQMQGVESEYYYGDNNKIDTEFDVFYFNFMGYSGRLTFDKNGQVVMLTVNNLKATYSGSVYSGAFVITDGDGVVYSFDKAENTPNSVIPSINSWYLTNISKPGTNESIDFKYRDYGYNLYRTGYGKESSFQKIRYQDASSIDPSIPSQTWNPVCSQEMNYGTIPNEISNTGGIILDRIGFGSDTVRFYHDTSRADVYKVKLDSIKVFQGATAVHLVKFSYGYSNPGGDALSKKLLLSTVTLNDQSPYTFSYYDTYQGKTMASIFAKGEDFWGFYNGEDFPEKPNGDAGPPRFRSLAYGQTDNGWNSSYRNPDYQYAQLGSLKSMTYPTGGRTEFEYEGNDFTEGFTGGPPEDDLSIALLLDSVRTNGIIAATAPGNYFPSGLVKSKEIMIHQGQTVTVSTGIGLANEINTQSAYASYLYNYGAGYEATVRLYKFNTTTGVFDLLEDRSYNPVVHMGLPGDDPSFYSARTAYGTSAESHTLSLTEGRYKVEAEIPLDAYGLTASINISNAFKYRKYAVGTGWYISYKYNAGGIRIKKLSFISPVNSSSYEKSYEYTDENKSSGWLESPFANVTSSMYWGEMRLGSLGVYVCPQLCNFYYFHYDNVIPLGNAQGGVIGYSKVTERMNDGRKKVMYYSIAGDAYNYDYLGTIPIIDKVTIDNSAFRGLPIYTEYFNAASQKIRTESHGFAGGWTYAVANLYPMQSDIAVSQCDINGPYFNNFGQGWGGYYHYQTKVVPGTDVIKDFNGTDSVTAVTRRVYANWGYTNPTTVTRYISGNDSTVTHYKYPYDYTFSGPVTPPSSIGVVNLLNSHVISSPVEAYTAQYIAGTPKVMEAQLLSYHPTLTVPDSVYMISSAAGLTDFTPATFSASTAVKDSRYQRKLLFDKYNHGHVVEQRTEGDVKEVLLWGYDHRHMVARISSSDYNTVIALVDSTVLNNPSSDAALRSELNNIRTALASANPKAKVTTYTYSLLKGMSSMTDPKGETIYYEYDPYGKMKRRKDDDAAIKENIWYHYQP